ncbi:MAG: amino acid adenylation domain-containing protein, partial [Bacteroidia bacterium]
MRFLEFLQYCKKKNIKLMLENEQLRVSAPPNILDPDTVTLIRQFKPDVIAKLKEDSSAHAMLSDDFPRIVPIHRTNEMLASFGQEQLWFTSKLNEIGTAFHFSRVLEFRGDLNVSALRTSFSILLERHESLRTIVKETNIGLVQQVLDSEKFEFIFEDLIEAKETTKLEKSKRLQEKLFNQSFDLNLDFPIKLHLLRLENNYSQLILVLHHIVSDGWSMGILVHEICALYNQIVNGEKPHLKLLPIQYGDFSDWQRKFDKAGGFKNSKRFWQDYLQGSPELHSLPLAKVRPLKQTFTAQSLSTKIDKQTSKHIKKCAMKSSATLFMVLESLFAILVSRYSACNDLIIGTPIANREDSEIESLIGYFVNLIPLRHELDHSQTFLQYLTVTKKNIVSTLGHQSFPFSQIIQSTVKLRNQSYNPLIQIVFVLQNNEVEDISLHGLKCQLNAPEVKNTIFDLQLEATEVDEGIELCWIYNSELFENANIKLMARHFEQLITNVLEQPDLPLGEMELLNESERRQQLYDWNTSIPITTNRKCIHELFELQVLKSPDNVALLFENKHITYFDLNARANRLARHLKKLGVKSDTLVGLYVDRSFDMITSILAVLKTGGAYVPFDPDSPEFRSEYMLRDAQIDIVITQAEHVTKFTGSDRHLLVLDSRSLEQCLTEESSGNLPISYTGATPNHLAYVIFTSGSAGKPKGVMVTHQNVTRLFDATRTEFGFGPSDVWTLFHSYAFDFSVWEIWGALLQGGKLVIVPFDTTRSSSDFYQLVVQQNVTVLNQTPSAFQSFASIDEKWRKPLSLRYVIFGGEDLNVITLKSWLEERGEESPKLVNMYGITETTVHVTYRRIRYSDLVRKSSASPIGRAISDLSVYLLTPSSKLSPISVVGEIYVAGDGVARGYLNQDRLTQDKFVKSPFNQQRLYKTGDLARWTIDGQLEYIGRIDNQVKIRGFRIELGEIEYALNGLDIVENATVMEKSTDSLTGDRQLVAYIVSHRAKKFEQEAIVNSSLRYEFIDLIRQELSKLLPHYMVPTTYVVLSEFPLTKNGKINRKALPEPDITQQQKTFIAPSNILEEQLCLLWQKLLGIEQLGITDNFFELGGHSLLATRLISSINQQFNVDLPLKSLFDCQTIETLALIITGLTQVSKESRLYKVGRNDKLSLSFSQQRLWLLDKINGSSTHYNMPGGLRLSGQLD